MTRKLISFDWAIKKVLRNKANFGILEGFLSELLFTDITIIELLESESDKEDKYNKYNRIDIKVKNSNNEIILIEVQYSRELDYLHRILFGTSKTITEHLKEGSPYSDISKIISVNILYFEFGKGDDYIYHGTTSFIGLHNKTRLQLTKVQKKLYNIENVSDIYPEYYLIEVKKFDDIAKDTLDEWIYFFKNADIKNDFKAKGLKEAQEKLDILKMNKAEKFAYDNYQDKLHREASLYESTYIAGKIEGEEKGRIKGKKEGRIEGKEEGRIEGKEEGILITAKNMKKENIPNTIIAKVTGLSIEKIETL